MHKIKTFLLWQNTVKFYFLATVHRLIFFLIIVKLNPSMPYLFFGLSTLEFLIFFFAVVSHWLFCFRCLIYGTAGMKGLWVLQPH